MKQLRFLVIISLLLALIPAQVFARSTSGYLSTNNIETADPRAKDTEACSPEGAGSSEATATKSLEEFIDKYGQLAFNTGKSYGIPYEAIIAQASLESGNGRSQLTRQAFNFFGIKAGSSWNGPTVSFNTEEEGPGGRYTVEAKFRKYASAQEGFNGYGEFITTNDRYKPALKYSGDPAAYIAEIKKAGYATDSQYVSKNIALQQKVIAYIKSKNLFPPSSEVTPSKSPPPASGTTTACSSPTGSAEAIVAVATKELNLKPVEYDKNVLKYTQGRREAWCADFVSWVYREAGFPFVGAKDGWNESFTIDLQAAARAGRYNLRYFAVGDEKPQRGDIAFYFGAQTADRGSTRHVNIVVDVSDDGKRMTVIGGNQSDKVTKYSQSIVLGDNSLVGFARAKKV